MNDSTKSVLTESVQDYVKAIYKLSSGADKVTMAAISERLGVSGASVTAMLKRLAEMRLIEYEPYRSVRLTEAGQKIALEVVRHHRLLELYLVEALGYRWDEVHQEAEKLEHVLSEEMEERMSRALGNPMVDPHGDPIPTKEGFVRQDGAVPLASIAQGERVVVRRVNDRDPELLRYIAERKLLPNSRVHVVTRGAPDGSIRLKVGRQHQDVSSQAAQNIFVTRLGVRTPAE